MLMCVDISLCQNAKRAHLDNYTDANRLNRINIYYGFGTWFMSIGRR